MSAVNIQATNLFVKIRLLIVAIILGGGTIVAQDKVDNDEKTLLIINSYHEDELWGNEITQPLMAHLAHVENLNCDLVYLNNSIITDSLVYKKVENYVFDKYQRHHPDYVVMVGNFAFNLRERMYAEWGKIPFLLVTRSEGYGPLNDYFANYSTTSIFETRDALVDLQGEYDFSCIIMPDYCKQTIDLMVKLLPEMKKLVFISDAAYVNRIAAQRLHNNLIEEYPAIKFQWLIGIEDNAEILRDYLVTPDPTVGLLMSSWCYATLSARGFPVLTTKDLNLVDGALNPVFTLRQAYMRYGAIGGVFPNFDDEEEMLIKYVSKLLAGDDMSKVPFYIPDHPRPTINYLKLKEYNLPIKNLPKDTVFQKKPQTYWEKYWMLLCSLSLVAIVIISLLVLRNRQQRRRINVLNRMSDFIEYMPIPYTSIHVRIKGNKEVLNIDYKERNSAIKQLIAYYTDENSALKALPASVFIEKSLELTKEGESLSFIYHVERDDTYYDIVMRLVKQVNEAKDVKSSLYDIFVRDITTTQRAQKKLRDAAAVINMSMDITHIVPWQLNLDTMMLSFDVFNKYMSQSHQHAEVIKAENMNDYFARIYIEDRQLVKDTFDRIRKGEIEDFCLQYRVHPQNHPDAEVWYENRGAITARDDKGKPITVTGSVRNIDEAKEHEVMMQEALQKANESDRMKSAFLANMSHEIRTPLNAIVGFSNMIVKTEDEAKKEELAKVIQRNNDLLLNLINDVLDLAKIESNTIDIMPTVCDVNDLLDSIGKTMSLRIPQGVLLNIVHYTDKLVIEADSGRITQIIVNFLTNASKFTSKGSITVGYELNPNTNMLKFFVKDTGIGISPENQQKIFRQFVKLNTFAQGTGLGLAICKSLVDRMGGEIGVTSEGLGCGSTFWFTLPYVPIDLQSIDDDQSKEKEEVEYKINFKTVNQHIDKSRLTVLVAEDNDSNFWLMEHMLGSSYNIIHAPNGRIAVEMFKQFNPDMIIMDINMPEMDGYEATKEIRKISKDVPIIAVTAYAFASDRIRILNSGFSAYVAKPVTEISLYDAINSVLN